jgi:hypothetical protein
MFSAVAAIAVILMTLIASALGLGKPDLNKWYRK